MSKPEIISICIKPDEPGVPVGFSRVMVRAVRLIAGFGVEGDVRAGHPRRQLNLIDQVYANKLRDQGYKTDPGQLGEHLIVSEIDLASLEIGARLRLGETLIEVTGRRTGCSRFKAIQQTECDNVALGVMAKVIEGGMIAVGDPVTLLPISTP